MTSIPTRKIEMKTAIELADAIDNSEETTGFERRCAAMLRTQDEQLKEWLKANAPGGWIDELRKERDGLLMAISDRDSILRQYSAVHAVKASKS